MHCIRGEEALSLSLPLSLSLSLSLTLSLSISLTLSLTLTLSLSLSGQNAVLAAVRDGESVFFTGAAGTGKSYVLGELTRMLPKTTTFVCATTGLAACHVGGTLPSRPPNETSKVVC